MATVDELLDLFAPSMSAAEILAIDVDTLAQQIRELRDEYERVTGEGDYLGMTSWEIAVRLHGWADRQSANA